MNLKILLILFMMALATILILVSILLTWKEKTTQCDVEPQASLKKRHNNQSLVFAGLSEEEMIHVISYLQSHLGLSLVDAFHASPSDNCIYYVDLQLPCKDEVLKFLDHGGASPTRQALVVVYFGSQSDPNITEYVVGPLPVPTYHRDVTVQRYGRKLPYYSRMVLGNEYEQIAKFLLEKKLPEAPTFLNQVFGHNGSNFQALPSAPRGFQSGDRATWIVLFQNVPGFFLHPVGMELLVDHSSLNVSHWSVPKVFYNGQYYNGLSELERAFLEKRVHVEKIKTVSSDGSFSSVNPRVPPVGFGPVHYEPCGPRYSVSNNQVVSSLWSFAFRMDVNRGPHIYDIRFQGHRIVYELSVQDAISVYGSNSPGGMSTRYMDGSFGIGRFTYSLVKGVDCPYSATYLDAAYLIDTLNPEVQKNSICVFEENLGAPFRRHYSNLQSHFYGGLTGSALVLRSVATLGNYDYVWDFVFHLNGAIESKVRATGYITSSFLHGDGLDYGNRVADHTLGIIHTHMINYKVDLDVGAICTAMAFILGWIFQTRREKPPVCESQHQDLCSEKGGPDGHSLVFADLTLGEMMQVKRYLWHNLGVPLVELPQAKPSDNCIYSIDLHLPPKAEVLEFLDHQGRKPTRQALAVVHFGNQEDPNVTEYVVGPLPKPTYHKDITVQKYGGKLPYYRRFFFRSDLKEVTVLFMHKEYPRAPNFMNRVLYYNGRNLVLFPALPPGFKSGDRKVWMGHFQNVSGSYLHPVGLELQVDVSSLDTSEWKVLNVFYNGQYFKDMEDLERQFNEGRVKVAKVKKAPLDGGYSSLKPRVPSKWPGPLQYEPRGPRYCIRDNQVIFMSWSFAFGMEVNRGPRIFDIRFEGERIVYELSTQDASALYGSNSPGKMTARYMDQSFALGKGALTLTQGVDCPYLATYLDTHYLIDSSLPVTHKNSICIFEQNAEIPVRRHYDQSDPAFYGGLVDSVLVFRSISQMGNYDYVWDFVFHQNGAVGIRVHASGYIQTSIFFGNATDFGNRVEELTLGAMHTHNIHYKVDLDVGGVKNSLVTNDMTFTKVRAPWDQQQEIHQMRLKREVLDTEDEAAFRLHDNFPRHIYFAANSTNMWGHERGYRIQIYSFSGDHLPESDPMERAISWGRYKLAVTKRKEEEPFSTSVYNQNDPWTPSVAFGDFINNETITNEDLVAWITVGFLHIPHAEDIPNTVTLGNAVGFMLRPYNYFDNDPSMYSPDGVFFTSEQDPTSCDVNHIACLPKAAACVPSFPPFSYEGFQNLTRL